MFNKIGTATVVLSGLLLSGASQAAEVSVEQLVGSMVSQAAYTAQQEISYGIQEAVLTANHTISVDSDPSLYAANVTITDLHDDAEVKHQNDETE